MKNIITSLILLAAALAFAQNTTFTYQGRVTSNGTNFTGTGQFKFTLVTSTNTAAQATAAANPPSGGFITVINVLNGGSGYISAPTVTISGGGGSGATATATINGGTVTGITVNTPGSGYTSTPTVNLSAPPATITYTTYWSNDGTSVAGSQPTAAVNAPVAGGLFTVMLGDTTLPNMAAIPAALFAAQPNLQLRSWFNDGVNGFAAVNPAQPLTPAPYAAFANSASNLLGALPVSQLNGMFSLAQLPASVVTNGASGVNFSGTFGGNGAGMTNVSISSLSVSGPANYSVFAWGNNFSGQATVPPGLTNVASVAVGGTHSLALKSDGTAVGWGDNGRGQITIPAGLTNLVGVAAGGFHSMVLKNDGTVVAWGDNGSGQTNVPAGLANVVAVAAGFQFSLALKNDGTVVAWGGGLTNVPAGLNSVVAVAAGGFHCLALRNDGKVVAWGGQTNVPVGLGNVVAVAAGVDHSLALKSDGTVVAWGGNSSGQTNVPAGLGNLVAVAAGFQFSLALKNDGTVVAWGASGPTSVPVGLNNVVALAPGCYAGHVLVVQRQVLSPLAQLNGPNTFTGVNVFNGKVGINVRPTETLHVNVPSNGSGGVGMEIDSDQAGHSPAIYLNHTGAGGRKFRLASYGNNSNPGSFVLRDDTAGADRLTIDAAGIISGNGSGLILSTNVALRAGGNAFSGNQTVTGGSLAINLSNPGTYSLAVAGIVGATNNNTEGFEVSGSAAGYALLDRTTGTRWSMYAIGDSLRFYFNGDRMTINSNGAVSALSFTPTSDRSTKENFRAVDAQAVLAKVVALPITEWNFKAAPGEAHLGPMAQDFHAAFGVGPDDKHIATVDADGVALAAIQGLNEKVERGKQNAEMQIKELKAENAELKARLERLERLLSAKSGETL